MDTDKIKMQADLDALTSRVAALEKALAAVLAPLPEPVKAGLSWGKKRT